MPRYSSCQTLEAADVHEDREGLGLVAGPAAGKLPDGIEDAEEVERADQERDDQVPA